MHRLIAVGAAAVVAMGASVAVAKTKTLPNGDFEKGTFAKWTKTNSNGSGGFELYGPGDEEPGEQPPARGQYSPSAFSSGPTANALTRVIKVPKTAKKLKFRAFWINYEGEWVFQNEWSPNAGSNQYMTIDLLKPKADPLTAKKKDTLKTIYKPVEGSFPVDMGPVMRRGLFTGSPGSSDGWKKFSVKLKPYRGDKVQLRIVEVDNMGPIPVGIDDVALKKGKKKK